MKTSKLGSFRITFCIAVSFLFLQPVIAQQAFNATKIDSFLTFLSKGKMMGSVAIVKNGKAIYQGHIGRERLDVMEKSGADNFKTNERTMYRIGSVSKTYTATMIMQLVEEGKLKLEDPLTRFYPTIKSAEGVQIRHLLNHHSGVPSFTDDGNLMNDVSRKYEKKELLKFLEEKPAEFNAGSDVKYSNSNYLILGWLIEDLSGKNYSANLRQHITQPLGLKYTHTIGNEPKNFAIAKSYRMQDQWAPTEVTNGTLPGGAGVVVSSASEVGIFLHHLLSGKLVHDSSKQLMTKMEDGFGFGLFAVPFYNQKLFGHNGRIDGFESMAAYNPADSTAFVILANGLNYVMNDVAIGVLSSYYNRPFRIPEPRAVKNISYTQEELERYTGEYKNANLQMTLTVSIQGKALIAQASGQTAFPLNAVDEHTFTFTAAGIEIKFGHDKEGKMQQLNLIQNNMLHTFHRTNDQ